MDDTIKVICENSDSHLYVNMGSSLRQVAAMLGVEGPNPYLAAYVNNELRELDYKIYQPISVRFIDITHFEGIRVYQRTLFFVLNKAVLDLYPGQRMRIKHSVAKGFYCEIDGMEDIPQTEIDRIRARMDEIIMHDIPIVR
ncbi:MAG: nucleoside kinase, partial [Rikenellaceae bacterium]|nr:nucleoside kinase [Rikenellaceae bacterium]